MKTVVKPMYQRKIDEFRQMDDFKLSVKKDSISSISYEDAYVITANMNVHFHANRVNYENAKEAALSLLMSSFYHDIIPQLKELRVNISDGDKRKSLNMVNEILDYISR
jgi:hypothetical protein